MRHSDEERLKTIQMRQEGFNFQEIADMTQIPKGTVRHWTYKVILDSFAKKRLAERKSRGAAKGRASWKAQRDQIKKELYSRVEKELDQIDLTPNLQKLLCSLLFWAEGAKNVSSVRFINSDPNMIRVFMKLFKASFAIDEKKFRAILHLHPYHDENTVKAFWSEVTQIPLSQFTKSYIKPNTGKRKKEGYMGTLNIRYYSARIAQELFATYNTLTFQLNNRGIG